MNPSLTVAILTRRRPALLRACLESVAAADLAAVREVLVVVNGEDAEAEAIAADVARREGRVRAAPIPRSSRGRARALAARLAAAPIVHFLDDDVIVPPGLFSATARRFSQTPDAAGVGGPNLTPPDSGAFERAVGRVLSSRLGAWRMRARYAPVGPARRAGEECLTLCSLALRADADGPAGLRFPERLVSAEENLLLERIEAAGGRFLYDPALFVWHRRRRDLRGFLSQTFKSGAGRGQAALLLPRCLKPAHLAPAALAAYLLLLPLAAGLPGGLLPAAAYAAALAAEAALAARDEGPLAGALVAALIPLHHLAYAAGFLLAPALWVEAQEPAAARA